jgi:general secretion pathway protein E/type IV pilus assembly protein PilB
VFSTLHTNDAPSAVTRLLDIGVKPFLVASSLRAAMAQRLVRTVCENCKEEYAPEAGELNALGATAQQAADLHLYRGRGCNKCNLTGYKGRKGIFEIFRTTDEIQRMIFRKVPANELRAHARETGMRSLREDGLRKAVAGVTTVDEILRVTMGDVD